MKKIIRLLLCLALSSILILTVVPAFAEETVTQEVNVTNVTWEQSGDILYIYGSGDMVINYEYITDIPWYDIRSEISKIVIGDGITSIYDSAFADFRLVKEVVFPNSLRVIGPAAFISCTSLESVTLPYKITRINDGAFCNCEALSSITIPASIVEISSDAFYNCPNLTIVGVQNTYAQNFAKERGITFNAGLSAPDEILVRVNDSYVDFDQPPVIIDDRTLVPVRAIFEAMGIEVLWDAETRTVSAKRDNIAIKMVIDTNIIKRTIDGKTEDITIDVPAQIIGDRTMVPARAIAESFLAKVNWNGPARTVIVLD